MNETWILVSAPTEGAVVDSVWDGDEWAPIANINDAALLRFSAGLTIEAIRAAQGEFQQRYTDRDVRIAKVSVTVALI